LLSGVRLASSTGAGRPPGVATATARPALRNNSCGTATSSAQ
jgi:hypothetical protein